MRHRKADTAPTLLYTAQLSRSGPTLRPTRDDQNTMKPLVLGRHPLRAGKSLESRRVLSQIRPTPRRHQLKFGGRDLLSSGPLWADALQFRAELGQSRSNLAHNPQDSERADQKLTAFDHFLTEFDHCRPKLLGLAQLWAEVALRMLNRHRPSFIKLAQARSNLGRFRPRWG